MKKNVWKSKIKYLWLFILLLIVVFASTGCSEKPTPREITGLVFKVEKDGRTSYLMGSVHISKNNLTFAEKTEEAYRNSDRLAVEIDISDQEISKQLEATWRYSNGDVISNYITQQTKDHITKVMRKISWCYYLLDWWEDLGEFNADAISSAIGWVELQSLGYDGDLGIDSTLMRKAKKDNKNIYSLETVDERLKKLKFNTSEQYVNELLQSCNYDLLETQKTMEYLTEMVFNGDFDAWERYYNDSVQTITSDIGKELASYVFDERNVNMAERMDKLFTEDKTTFAVVGAAHLVGNQGIVNILKNKGYTVTQIK